MRDKVNREHVANVVDREFNNHKYKEVLVSDLTYISVAGECQYISFITDLFNREILGYAFGPKKDSVVVYKAFMSIGSSLKNIEYFHTDRGSKFKTDKALEQKLFEYVHRYNNKRLHSNLDYMSPVAYKNNYLENYLH